MSDTINTGRVILGTIPGDPFLPVQIVGARSNRTALSINGTNFVLYGPDQNTTRGNPGLLPPNVLKQFGEYQGALWAAVPGPAFQAVTAIISPPISLFFTETINFGSEDVLVSLPNVTGVGAGQDFFLSEPASSFSIQTVSTGAPTYNVILQGSQDGISWFQIGKTSQSFYTGAGGSTPQTISADGLTTLIDGPVQHIRLNCTKFSGGTNPSLTASVIAS